MTSSFEIGTQRAAELRQFLLLIDNITVFVDMSRSNTQFRKEGVHPDPSSSDSYCAIRTGATDHLDTMDPRGIVGSDVLRDEFPIEHIGNDTIQHGFDVGGHSKSLPAPRWQISAWAARGEARSNPRNAMESPSAQMIMRSPTSGPHGEGRGVSRGPATVGAAR